VKTYHVIAFAYIYAIFKGPGKLFGERGAHLLRKKRLQVRFWKLQVN